jgi:probable phosphoglycerate mutase
VIDYAVDDQTMHADPAMTAREARVLLIRHEHTPAVGHSLSGRMPGVSLTAAGLAQAECLAGALASCSLAAIYSSPLERAVQTANPLARRHRLTPQLLPEAQEIDFGEWTGRSIRDLECDPAWQLFNRQRSQAVIPGGEVPAAVQARIVGALIGLARRHRGETFAMVTHADVIRFALAHFSGLPLDDYVRFVIDPGSVTAVVLGESSEGEWSEIAYVNAGAKEAALAECR